MINENDSIKKFLSSNIIEYNKELDESERLTFSVVIPSYNQGKYLERTIKSILNQNYKKIELIIIDGGSSDNSLEVIKKYESSINYWVSESDEGQADALNKGFSKATGDILCWLNSDDIFLPETISTVNNIFITNSNTHFIYGNIYMINEDDKIIDYHKSIDFHFPTHIYVGGIFQQPSTFWKRELYNIVGGVNKEFRFCMDADLFARMSEKNTPMYTEKFLSCFRVHDESKSTNLQDVRKAERIIILKRYIKGTYKESNVAFMKLILNFRRLLVYLTNGELPYLIRAIKKRIVHRY